jgi:hypothetical protein
MACNGDPEGPWWYQTDFIGHSITLPLNYAALHNLGVAGIDPSRVIEVLEASQDRESGIFKDISFLHPTRKLAKVVLCSDCRYDHYFFAWAEESRQLFEIVHALERQMDLDRQRYDNQWTKLKASPEKLKNIRFCDVPWPVRGSLKVSSPKDLRKSEVLRFLFARCTRLHYLYRRKPGLSPKEMVTEYKRTWDPKSFARHRPWYSQRLPSFLTQQAAIVEGVRRIRRFLDEYEYENWGVNEKILEDMVRRYSRTHPWNFSSEDSEKELDIDQGTIVSRIALGTALTIQTAAYVAFLRGLRL